MCDGYRSASFKFHYELAFSIASASGSAISSRYFLQLYVGWDLLLLLRNGLGGGLRWAFYRFLHFEASKIKGS